MKNGRKIVFLLLGFIFLALAYIGIILPGVPAIPFILLAGYFFLKSSERLYSWLLRQKIIGPVLHKFNSGEGVSTKMKWLIISQFWVSIIVAQFVFTMPIYLYYILNSIGIFGSILMYKLLEPPKTKK